MGEQTADVVGWFSEEPEVNQGREREAQRERKRNERVRLMWVFAVFPPAAACFRKPNNFNKCHRRKLKTFLKFDIVPQIRFGAVMLKHNKTVHHVTELA